MVIIRERERLDLPTVNQCRGTFRTLLKEDFFSNLCHMKYLAKNCGDLLQVILTPDH